MATGIEMGIAYGLTRGAIAALAKPVAAATWAGVKAGTAALVDVFSERLTDYVTQQAERHSCMSTIVFGHQKSLHDLYEPLTVVPFQEMRQEGPDKSGILIDRFNNEFLPEQNRVLITDTAGMGKSTLSKFLFLQCLKSAYAIPFFIELRHLTATTNVMTVLQRQLNPISVPEDEPKFSKPQIQRMLKKGNLVFFFDGYDEIPPEHREAVTKGIKDLVENYPQNRYVITSRPESGLLAFPSFKQYAIRPLKRNESFNLIRRYDQGGGRAEQLISKLSGPDFQAVHEFLKNPLLTSLLYRSFEYKQSVPLKKHVFYRQVFDALFDWHDATKDGYNTREKKSGLDIDAFHRMLRVVGFVSVMTGKVEGDTDEVLGWIRKAKEVCKIVISESKFLEDLVRAVPVFVKDGDYYRWSHKSLAEYFAAQYICTEGKGQQKKILEAFVSSRQVGRFSNVLDQVYDIDNAAFREHLTLPAARAFAKYWANTYTSLDPAITEEEIRLRKSCTFDRTTIFFRDFSFNDRKDFRLGISEVIKPVTGSDLQFEPIVIVMLNEASRKNVKLVIDVPGPLNGVLSILEMKNDPLIMHKSKLPMKSKTAWQKGLGIVVPDESLVLTDDPNADYNQQRVFSQLTRLIAVSAPIVDADKMLNFEKSFNDSLVLSTFADDLLISLTGTTAPA